MNCRYRAVVIIVITLSIWGVIHFIYNLPSDVSSKFDLTDKIKLTVYYEALCTDSKFFITRQLAPLQDKIPDHITIELVPYGKAVTIESAGTIIFQCQHDELECYANKIHACVIDSVTDPSIQLKYVACMIKNNQNPDEIAEICGKQLNIDHLPILICAKEDKASQLLKKHGERTHALNPPVSFIPTIEINGSQDLAPLSKILKNLKQTVCSLFETRPTGCDN
ncbi:gamma-interferon-inducible lysosomal thiol reductase-like [Coccinella septempunctata]|uniref:gamma-interferon-inducible lysosomal thiol reductase-like n=1 Tax=Coccinella septempunctata TaxID=41139 RepID=UPI001D0889ED|nr:gamma-interferon-inducible lysosomal thiol reductase-like [Coccinella septempunctata]